jgi:hypothetical protein
MALANFFDRALMSAGQAIRGGDPSAIRARLGQQVVELAFDGVAANAAEGRAGLDLALRLLVRLYPTIRLTALDPDAQGLATELSALARAINPDVELKTKRQSTVRLVFGDTAPAPGLVTIFAGSDRWLAKVSTRRPLGVGKSEVPFGAGAAACLGAANVFRAVLGDFLPKPALDDDATLSLFDFSTGGRAACGPKAPAADLRVTPLVGLGAIGHGVIWTLSRTPGLTGVLHLIDPEQIELSNLQRYVLALQTDVGRVKTELARGALAAGPSSISLFPFVARWDEYLAGRGHDRVDRVVTALDTAADRIGVQASLPRRILNAWTQVGDLGVSRHGFVDADACLACLYRPSGELPSQDRVIARALRLTEDHPVLLDLRERLVNGLPVGETFVRDTALRLGLPPEDLLCFADQPLRQFYAKAICGGQAVGMPSGGPAVEVPLAFQSAMAGIMLAAELVADAGKLRNAPLPTKTVLDLTRPLAARPNVMVAKPPVGSTAVCICQDRDFIAAYRAKHFGSHGTRAPKGIRQEISQ